MGKKKDKKSKKRTKKGKSKKDVKNTKHFDKKYLKELKDAFDLFDKDETKTLDFEETKCLLRAKDFNLTEKQLEELIQSVDKNENGVLEFDEMIKMIQNAPKAKASNEADLREALSLFDETGTNKISTTEFRVLMTTLGERLTDQDVDEMLEKFTVDKEGFIHFDDIVKSLS